MSILTRDKTRVFTLDPALRYLPARRSYFLLPFTFCMLSIYETTSQGRKTRSQLLQHIQPGEELTREQLMNRTSLTYEQVRRQTKNLSIEGTLQSRMEAGKRVYKLRVGGILIALLIAWSVSIGSTNSDDDDEQRHHSNSRPTFIYQPNV